MKVLQSLALVLITVAGLSRHSPLQAQEPAATADALPPITFQVPPCLPLCTAEHRAALGATSAIEGAYIRAINQAHASIAFSQFTFSSRAIYGALVQAASRGVKVQGIMDRGQFKTTGAFCEASGCTPPPPFDSATYLAGGVNERLAIAEGEKIFREGTPTDKLALLLHHSSNASSIKAATGSARLVHNKLALVDDAILLTGSGNWSSTAVSVNLENLAQFTRSAHAPVLDSFRCMFDVVWTSDGGLIGRELGNCQRSGLTYFSPTSGQTFGPQNAILEAIATTQTKVDISMHHLADPEVFDALDQARARGVAIRIAVDDDDCNGPANARMEALVAAGVLLRFVPTSCQIFQLSHSKYGIFDGNHALNGSANWSKAGLKKNYENFISYRETPAVTAFNENFETIWNFATEQSQCRCDKTEAACRERYCL